MKNYQNNSGSTPHQPSFDPKALEMFGTTLEDGIKHLKTLEEMPRIYRYIGPSKTPDATYFIIDPNLVPAPRIQMAHGPQILQTITHAIDGLKLYGKEVRSIKSVSFKKPIKKNHIIAFTTNGEGIPEENYCHGELETDIGSIFFAVIDHANVEPTPLQKPIMIPIFYSSHFTKGQNAITQKFFIPAAPIVRTAMVSEDLLCAALTLLDNTPGLGLKNFPLRVLTKITNLTLKNIDANGEYSIQTELTEKPTYKPNEQHPEKVFCNMNYTIFKGNQCCAQGVISVALLKNSL